MAKQPRNGRGKAQENKILAAKAEGKSNAQIARETGLSRKTVSRTVNTPEFEQRVAQLVDANHEAVESIFTKSLRCLDEAMDARDNKAFQMIRKREEGETLTTPREEEFELVAPPDHYARLTAVKTFITLITAGRPPAREKTKHDGTLTLEQIAAVLEQADEELQ